VNFTLTFFDPQVDRPLAELLQHELDHLDGVPSHGP
jgi:peptide deformylase